MCIKKEFLLLLFICLIKITYTQSLVYTHDIQHVQTLSTINTDYKELFKTFTANPNATISIYYTFQIKIYHEKEQQYSILISYQEDSVAGDVLYRQLTLADLFYPKRVFCNGNIVANGKNILPLRIQNQAITLNNTLLDTVITTTEDSIQWTHHIEYLQFYLDDSLTKNCYLRTKKIDAYYHCDSLFYKWNKELDKLNLSNVDLLPIYKFTLEDVEKEVNAYVANQFENILSLSKIDNTAYLIKVSKLFNRLNNIKKYLIATLPDMDEMLYRKGVEFEQQNNYEKAVHYYKRSLDYNPTCSLSIVALSNYYLNKKDYTKAISSINTLYKDTIQVIENHSMAYSIYQTLYDLAKEQMNKNDYYSASKTLDTLAYYCSLIPLDFSKSNYQLLRQKARQGIYDSYMDVILAAINNEKFGLAATYLQGLENIIKKNKDTLEVNEQYNNMLQLLWGRYSHYINQKITEKQYIFALIDIKEFNNSLDSLQFNYPEQFFSDIYTIYYSSLYEEKITEINELKENKNNKNLSEKIKETEDFYITNQQYIQDKNFMSSKSDEEKERIYFENRYYKLCSYLKNIPEDIISYDFLDSCILSRKWQLTYQFDDCSEWDDIVENKCKPVILSKISRINTFIWGNEFKKALPLFKDLTTAIHTLSLTTDTVISQKYRETQSILQSRACAYLEREKIDVFNKASDLLKQKVYDEAEKTLLSVTSFSIEIECNISPYNDSINHLLQYIKKPAHFQRIYNNALLYISVQKYEEGFRLYDEAFHYFKTQDIDSYGLYCPDKKEFLINSKNTNYYSYICEQYVQEKEFDKAIEIMLSAVSQKLSFNKTQKTIGEAFSKYVKDNKLRPFQAIKPYRFTKAHSPFLNAFLGKPIAFFYLLIH